MHATHIIQNSPVTPFKKANNRLNSFLTHISHSIFPKYYYFNRYSIYKSYFSVILHSYTISEI